MSDVGSMIALAMNVIRKEGNNAAANAAALGVTDAARVISLTPASELIDRHASP